MNLIFSVVSLELVSRRRRLRVAETGEAVGNNEIADELRVSHAKFQHAQWNGWAREPRRSTNLPSGEAERR